MIHESADLKHLLEKNKKKIYNIVCVVIILFQDIQAIRYIRHPNILKIITHYHTLHIEFRPF